MNEVCQTRDRSDIKVSASFNLKDERLPEVSVGDLLTFKLLKYSSLILIDLLTY